MIREFQMSDTEQVMKLWLSANIAHIHLFQRNTGVHILTRYRKHYCRRKFLSVI